MVSPLFGRDVCDHANQASASKRTRPKEPDLDTVLERHSSYGLFNELMDRRVRSEESDGYTP